MTSLGEKLSLAKKDINFESDVLKQADKFTKKEFKKEIDARINIMNDQANALLGLSEEDREEVSRRVKKEAKVLSLMYLRKYPK